MRVRMIRSRPVEVGRNAVSTTYAGQERDVSSDVGEALVRSGDAVEVASSEAAAIADAIHGIGPELADRLIEAGMSTTAEIISAAMTEAGAQAILDIQGIGQSHLEAIRSMASPRG